MKYLLAIVFLSLGFSQNSQDIIYWSEDIRLEWKDFKGPPQPNPTHKAMTMSGLSTSLEIYKDTLTVISRCVFDRTKSWSKIGSLTVQILEHEQIHFDITELLCRRIKKAIKEKSQLKRKTAQMEVSNIIKDATNQYVTDQNLYDRESYPSIDKQNEWKTKVALELKSLSDFQGPIVKVMLTN